MAGNNFSPRSWIQPITNMFRFGGGSDHQNANDHNSNDQEPHQQQSQQYQQYQQSPRQTAAVTPQQWECNMPQQMPSQQRPQMYQSPSAHHYPRVYMQGRLKGQQCHGTAQYPTHPQATMQQSHCQGHQTYYQQFQHNPHRGTQSGLQPFTPRSMNAGDVDPGKSFVVSEHQERSIQHARFFGSPHEYAPLGSSADARFEKQQSRSPALTSDPGPKQSRKPTASAPETSNGPQVQLPKWDAKLLFPANANGSSSTNGASSASAASTEDSRSNTADEDVGMSRFMPNLHRTVARESVPQQQRKRKSEDGNDDEPDQKKAKFTGVKGNGLLGEHLKEERQKAAAQAGPAPIDLTADNDDDDDIQVVAHKEHKNYEHVEVCLGVLNGKANIHRIPAYPASIANALNSSSRWPRVKMMHRLGKAPGSKAIELIDRSNKVVGVIEPKLATALHPILATAEQNRVRIAVWLNTFDRHAGETAGESISRAVDIFVIIHAPRGKGQMIGSHLSRAQFWLSAPSHFGLQSGKDIENPHMPANYAHRGTTASRTQAPQSTVVARTAEQLREQTETLFDSLVHHDKLPRMDLDDSIIISKLLDHQKQALYFMNQHERCDPEADKKEGTSTFSMWRPEVNRRGERVWVHVITSQEVAQQPEPMRGGILADMMGLGKTLEILALVAHTKQKAAAFGEQECTMENEELERNAKTTLVVCPKSVMSNWAEQIRSHCRANQMTFYNYHGSNRVHEPDELAQWDVVLTTYNTVASDLRTQDKALFRVHWFRIVLDEAHSIRNPATGISRACIELSAERRWAVTGTPVQNGLNDLGPLIRFLRLRPFDDNHIWNQYILSPLRNGNEEVVSHLRLLVDSITLRRMKDKIGLKQRFVNEVTLDFPEKDRRYYDNIATRSRKNMDMMTNGGRLPYKGKTYAHMLRLIDRMRRYCAHGLDMFREEERKEIEEGMDPDNAIAIDLGDEPGDEPYKFASNDDAYNALYLLGETDADRCEMCGSKITEKATGAEVEESDESSSDEDEKDATDKMGILTPCFHLICNNCEDSYTRNSIASLEVDGRFICPCCTALQRYGLIPLHRGALRRYVEEKDRAGKKQLGRRVVDESTYTGPSIKVQHLISALQKVAEASDKLPEDQPPYRSVVFSQWTTYLDLIEIALDANSIPYLRLDGSMSVSARTKVMHQFRTDPSITVILVSIKAGGQGLNFTAANYVYMMEPQYNPGVEQQAIDRVHRLGQERDVFITHYFCKDTIEQKIKTLQERKKDLARFTLERKISKGEEQRRRIEAFRDLIK